MGTTECDIIFFIIRTRFTILPVSCRVIADRPQLAPAGVEGRHLLKAAASTRSNLTNHAITINQSAYSHNIYLQWYHKTLHHAITRNDTNIVERRNSEDFQKTWTETGFSLVTEFCNYDAKSIFPSQNLIISLFYVHVSCWSDVPGKYVSVFVCTYIIG